jgi:hypothetical protein
MGRQVNRWLAPILVAVILYPISASAQSISGSVLDSAGKPLADVEVYGIRESCCPSSVPWTSTGANGKYALKNAGSVIHFRRIDLKPLSLRTEGAHTLNAIMKPNESPMTILACEEHGTGRFGNFLRFKPSPTHGIHSGRDVDYESYGFRVEDGGALESWFGPTAANIDAFKERYIHSKKFSERAVFVPTLGVVGIDASGTYFNGRRWRWVGTDPYIPKAAASTDKPAFTWHLSISTNGVGYDNASVDDQKEFDTVIDSACARDPQVR